jgi:hypothetical protein
LFASLEVPRFINFVDSQPTFWRSGPKPEFEGCVRMCACRMIYKALCPAPSGKCDQLSLTVNEGDDILSMLGLAGGLRPDTKIIRPPFMKCRAN